MLGFKDVVDTYNFLSILVDVIEVILQQHDVGGCVEACCLKYMLASKVYISWAYAKNINMTVQIVATVYVFYLFYCLFFNTFTQHTLENSTDIKWIIMIK